MRKTNFVFAIAFGEILLASQIAKPQTGYPQPSENYINDFAAIITPQDANEIRGLLKNTEEHNGVEITVVTIHSIRDYGTNDATIELFATNLFNNWGVGDKTKNNGVMILVAVQDRKMRIELGSGYSRDYDAVMKQIIDYDMIPFFKSKEYSKGISHGAYAVVKRLTEAKSMKELPGTGTPAVVPDQRAWQRIYDQVSESSSTNPWPLVGLGAIAAAAAGFGVSRYSRYHKRRCSNCQTDMVRLDEMADDIYLESGQKLEELLESVDYDVWRCPLCSTHELHPYNKWFSRFKRCKRCGYRTMEADSEIIEAATYSSTGRKRITTDCRHCNFHDQDIVVIPQLTYSDNSSSGSSGGSFGGGSSSGGGASGSW